jgi:hypothetical protein
LIQTRGVLVALTVAALMLGVAVPAEATFPGANGRIAGTIVDSTDMGIDDMNVFTVNPDGTDWRYGPGTSGWNTSPAWSPDSSKIAFSTNVDGNWEIYAKNSDGSGQALRLTNNAAYDDSPAWSPDGTKIAFLSTRDGNNEIYVMNADGTGQTRLTNNSASDYSPDWSPGGAKIAFVSNRDGNYEIYSMNADGTGATRLTNDPNYQLDPSWSPDGSKIAYSSQSNIYVMNRDGSSQTPVTSDGSGWATPAWSPDGTKLAAWQSDIVSNDVRVVVMNADGTGVVPVFISQRGDEFGYPIDWGPVLAGYARPKGASPTQVFLVPAYAQCTTANRTHGAPLSFGSCAPPSQTSGTLTVGTPDAPQNGQPAKSFAKVIYTARTGDLEITTTISDVRKKSDLSDYTGELSLITGLRITDRNNTPNPGGPGPGTVADTTLPVTISCAPTPADNTVGSDCNRATTVNALYPGAITAGQRSIWELGQTKAYDGGPDGDAETTGDNTLFMDEGIFVP